MPTDWSPRPYPGLIGRQLGQRLVELVGRGARVLELGVGTSRLAVPLVAAGAHVVGIDLSAIVLAQWIATSARPAGTVRGDMRTLPFTTHAFDAAMAVHVLHAVPNSEAVVREVRRVLHPGTPLILGHDWRDPATIDNRIYMQWQQIVAMLTPDVHPTSPAGEAELLARLTLEGAQIEPEVALLQWSDQVSAATEIDQIATRAYSESWMLSDAQLQQSVEQLNAWMFATRIDPNATDIALREFRISLVRWPNETR